MKPCKTLEEVLNEINNNDVVLVDISTDWCMPCKILATELVKVTDRYKKVKVIKINKDDIKKGLGLKKWKIEIPALANALDLPGIPVLVFLKNGKVINEYLDDDKCGLGLYFGLVKYKTIVKTLKQFGLV